MYSKHQFFISIAFIGMTVFIAINASDKKQKDADKLLSVALSPTSSIRTAVSPTSLSSSLPLPSLNDHNRQRLIRAFQENDPRMPQALAGTYRLGSTPRKDDGDFDVALIDSGYRGRQDAAAEAKIATHNALFSSVVAIKRAVIQDEQSLLMKILGVLEEQQAHFSAMRERLEEQNKRGSRLETLAAEQQIVTEQKRQAGILVTINNGLADLRQNVARFNQFLDVTGTERQQNAATVATFNANFGRIFDCLDTVNMNLVTVNSNLETKDSPKQRSLGLAPSGRRSPSPHPSSRRHSLPEMSSTVQSLNASSSNSSSSSLSSTTSNNFSSLSSASNSLSPSLVSQQSSSAVPSPAADDDLP